MIRNTIEVELNGKTYGFRTGTYAWGLAIRECGAIDNESFVKRLSHGDVTAATAIFYASYVQYQQWKNLPVELNLVQISEVLEDLGIEKAQPIMDKLLESYKPKNQSPPQTVGEQNQPQ